MQLSTLRDHILAKLDKAQGKRKKLSGWTYTKYDAHPVSEWIVHEREVLLAAVNEERAKIGRKPIPMGDVVRVERMACGHSDYSSKLALYCAELVYQAV